MIVRNPGWAATEGKPTVAAHRGGRGSARTSRSLRRWPWRTAIQEHGSGQKIRRLTLFDALQRSPDSGPTRKLITGSVQYGLTTGGVLRRVPGPDGSEDGPRPTPAASARCKTSRSDQSRDHEHRAASRPSTTSTRAVAFPPATCCGTASSKQASTPIWRIKGSRCSSQMRGRLGLVKTIGGTEHLVSVDAVIDEMDADPSAATSTGGWRYNDRHQ